MKKLILCVAFSLIVINPCIADDPNNPVTANYNSYETRIKILEDKIIELENRIAELESQRPALPARGPALTSSTSSGLTSSTNNDPNKDSLRIERCSKAVKVSRNLIELYEAQWETLPTCYHLPLPDVNELKRLPPHYYHYDYYYLMVHYSYKSFDDALNWAIDNIELLDHIEEEYQTVKNYAQRNPELNIDRKDILKRLNELSIERGGFGKVRDGLYKDMPKGYRFMRSRCYKSISKTPIRNKD